MMSKYNAEIEYDDNSAAMAGAPCGALRRSEIVYVDAMDAQDAIVEIKKAFKEKGYCSIRRIGNVTKITDDKQPLLRDTESISDYKWWHSIPHHGMLVTLNKKGTWVSPEFVMQTSFWNLKGFDPWFNDHLNPDDYRPLTDGEIDRFKIGYIHGA